MRAIVLVGGAGTRLRPLTHLTPKALVPVLNRPLLEHLLLHLRSHAVTQVTLAMTERNETIRAAIGDGSALDLEVDYAYEDTPLGSGGAIASVAGGWPELPREPFLVVNGDIITDLDLSAMIAAHRERQAELTISLHEVEDPSAFGVVALADATSGAGATYARIERFVEKPPREEAPSHLVNAGTWIFDPALLRDMDATTFSRVEDGLFPELAQAGRPIFGFHRPCYWLDVGNPEAYRRVNLDLAGGAARGSGAAVSSSVQQPEGGRLVASNAEIAADATLGAPLVIGDACIIESRARVDESVLWDGVRVGAGAEIRRSVLASGVVVGAGAVIEGAVVAHGAVITAGERLPPGTMVEPDPHYRAGQDG